MHQNKHLTAALSSYDEISHASTMLAGKRRSWLLGGDDSCSYVWSHTTGCADALAETSKTANCAAYLSAPTVRELSRDMLPLFASCCWCVSLRV